VIKVVPLDRSHVRAAAALHRGASARCYRGKATPGVLRWFYDACANRDYTLAAAALEDGRLVAAACGATRPEAGEAWLARRRRWRALWGRMAGGRDLARGGWPAATLAASAAGEGRAAYLLALVGAAERLPSLVDAIAAAAASHGATVLVAPALAPDDTFITWGFEAAAGSGPPFFYRRKS